MSLEPYKLVLLLVGLMLLGAAWLPHLLRRRMLSFPIVYVAMGWLLYQLPIPLPNPDPIQNRVLTERLTELVILIALVGAGLRLDTPPGLRRWGITWRLLGIAMPLTIATAAVLGHTLVGLGAASAMLLAAVLAPTDPVLAADVQVGPPGKGEEDRVRFGLTSEAGLNDGLGFPFTRLALAMAAAAIGDPGWSGMGWFAEWLTLDLLYRTAAGALMGYGVGYLLMVLIFRIEREGTLTRSQEGFVAVAITLCVYGLAELVGGYGFLAVFVAAVAIRQYERNHTYHETLDLFAQQCERLLMTALLLLFGGALARGLLDALSWQAAVFGVVFVLLVRPLSGLLSLLGSHANWRERLAISAFGVRGVGSFYYLAYAFNHANFTGRAEMWATVGFVVLMSILLHGLAATPVMNLLDSDRDRRRRGDPHGEPRRISDAES